MVYRPPRQAIQGASTLVNPATKQVKRTMAPIAFYSKRVASAPLRVQAIDGIRQSGRSSRQTMEGLAAVVGGDWSGVARVIGGSGECRKDDIRR